MDIPQPVVNAAAVAGRFSRTTLKYSIIASLSVLAILLVLVTLAELSSRDWLVDEIKLRIERLNIDYTERKKPLQAQQTAESKTELLVLDKEHQVLMSGLGIIQRRTQILINVGANRISRTVPGMSDILEIYTNAHNVAEKRYRSLINDNDWRKPTIWTLPAAVDHMVTATSYRLDDVPQNNETNFIFYLKREITDFWSNFPERLSSNSLLLLLALSMGFVGSGLAVLLKTEGSILQHLMEGTIFGLLSFFLIKGGKMIIVLDTQTSGNPYNHYTVAALAFLSGMFHDRVRSILSDLVKLKPAASPAPPAAVAPAAPPAVPPANPNPVPG
ncbi:MAG: hypothetical protein OJJ21_12295 [Ferrovibrio sp.]|uniref:hypothetical protein n=1 Tax=Ferrovibrio sp. TaxID=1917215 RepID=UPI0026258B30|nr:hypothetical protein [Ferrovibrio sp.]MCW0234371.1 hypothetical protein [Ferrovibrio sp.]